MQISGSLMRMNSVNRCLGANPLILGRNFLAPKFAQLGRDSFEYTISFKGEKNEGKEKKIDKRNPADRIRCLKALPGNEPIDQKQLNCIRKLKPEILEEIGDHTLLAMVFSGNMQKIVTTLNGVSDDTREALKSINLNMDSIAKSLTMKKPTRESVCEDFAKKRQECGLGPYGTPKKTIDEQYRDEMARWKAQFQRIEYLNQNPQAIKELKGNQEAINKLEMWLNGQLTNFTLCPNS